MARLVFGVVAMAIGLLIRDAVSVWAGVAFLVVYTLVTRAVFGGG